MLPVIVDVHGGGWVYGNKELNEYYCMELAKLGFVVCDINYRLCPVTDLKGQVQDVTAALQWIFDHIHQYGGDSEQISCDRRFSRCTAGVSGLCSISE